MHDRLPNVARKKISSKNSVPALRSFTSYGFPIGDRLWKIGVSGIVWQSPVVYNRRKRMMIRMLGNVMKASPDDLHCDLFQTRIGPFMADAEHRKRITARIGDQPFLLRKKTRRNGHFLDWIIVSDQLVQQHAQADPLENRYLNLDLACEHPGSARVTGKALLIPERGISVVSDIDDTIKVSSVGNRRELLNNTFLREYVAVEGMSALYDRWARSNASFHYVSSSPWQLYEPLQILHQQLGFPVGTMHLRNFRLRDQLLKRVRVRRHGKSTAIRSLLKALPKREFVLIGDSGEKDSEIYRKICRAFPNRVKGLFIRQLGHRPLSPERLSRLRGALPPERCNVFTNASELAEMTRELFDQPVPA